MSFQDEQALNQGHKEALHGFKPSHRYEFCAKCGKDIQDKAQWYIHEKDCKGMICRECYLKYLEEEGVR
jgi:hypothetical protein